jgi:tetratricopeptide (TPR) repeat protein
MIHRMLIVLALSVGWPALVRADDAPADVANMRLRSALAHFDEGRALTAQHRYEEAVDQFLQSESLDPAPGTLANLAYCYEKLGRTAGAWIVYRSAARSAREAGKADWATRADASAAKLESTAPRLRLNIRENGNEPLEVWLDETELPPWLWNESPPVGPGRHQLRAAAQGKRPWSTTFEVELDRQPQLVVPPLEPAVDTARPPLPGRAPPAAVDGALRPRPRSSQRTAALALGGTGLVGLAVGSMLAAVSAPVYASTSSECARVCDSRGAAQRQTAIAEANAASLAFAWGGAAAIGASILWFTAPTPLGPVRVTPTIGRTEWEMTLGGGW